jgi:hypothetical protein
LSLRPSTQAPGALVEGRGTSDISRYDLPFTVNIKREFFFFLLPQRKNNVQRAVLAGIAVRSIGNARGKSLVLGKSGIKAVSFFLAGCLMKLTTIQAMNYSRNLTSNMVLWISLTRLSR